MSRKPYEPNEKDRNIVRIAKCLEGCKEANIAKMLQIDVKTLKKYYSEELDLGKHELNRNMAVALYKNGIAGNVVAQIFWLKSRGGWKEKDQNDTVGEDLEPTTVITKSAKVKKKAK